MRLAQLSNLRGFQRGSAALGKMLLVSAFMRYLEQTSAWEEDATTHRYRTKEGAITVKERAIGGSVTPDTVAPSAEQSNSLYNEYFALDIDETYMEDDRRGLMDLGGWIERELPEEIDSFTRGLEALFFKGTGSGTPAQLKGLKTILDGTTNIPGFSITGVINAKDAAASGTSFDLTDSANYKAFDEYLTWWITQVEDASGLACNPKMAARLSAVAKSLNIFSTQPDQFGRMVDHYGPLPIIKTLDTSILNNEPDDTPTTPLTNTTSLYVMSPGEQRVSLVTNSGLDYREPDLDAKQSGRIIGEIRLAWKIQKRNAIRRVRNIKV